MLLEVSGRWGPWVALWILLITGLQGNQRTNFGWFWARSGLYNFPPVGPRRGVIGTQVSHPFVKAPEYRSLSGGLGGLLHALKFREAVRVPPGAVGPGWSSPGETPAVQQTIIKALV